MVIGTNVTVFYKKGSLSSWISVFLSQVYSIFDFSSGSLTDIFM